MAHHRVPNGRETRPTRGRGQNAGMADFVPKHFEPPLGLIGTEFVLEPLGPEHKRAKDAGYAAGVLAEWAPTYIRLGCIFSPVGLVFLLLGTL